MMQVTHCTLYNYQLGDQQHTPITGYNVNSYTVHATMLNTCSVYLSHCSYGNQLLCDAIKAVVLATASMVLAVPLFSQPASWNHTIRKLCVYRAFQIGCQNHKITVISRASERDKNECFKSRLNVTEEI